MSYYLDISGMETDSQGRSLDEFKSIGNPMIVVPEGDAWVGLTTVGTFRFENVDVALLEHVRESLSELSGFSPGTGHYGVGRPSVDPAA
jgi:hypothetical protein